MQCLILAGGLATRMAPATDDCPKVMLEICGKPFALHQLDWLQSEGATEILYCVGHLADQVRNLGSHYRGMKLLYSEESEPLGKMDAIRNALPLLRPWFITVYGDSYCPGVSLRQLAFRFLTSDCQSRLMTTWQGVDHGLSIYWRHVFENDAFPVRQKWMEIGSPEGFAELEQYLILKQKEQDDD